MDFGIFGNTKPTENNNNDKNHYFIGTIIEDENLVKRLKKVRKKLLNKYNLQDIHFPNLMMANYIYLGYFPLAVAKLYMDDIMNYLLKAISEKCSKLYCNISNFKLTYDQVYYKIMLQFQDKNNKLEDIIIPYLYQKGITPVYGLKKHNEKPTIDVVYFKESTKIKEQREKFGRKFKLIADYPSDTFVIDTLCLIQGTPIKSRVGTPSTHDPMEFEKVKNYEFSLSGKNNNMNSTKNRNKSNNETLMNNRSNNSGNRSNNSGNRSNNSGNRSNNNSGNKSNNNRTLVNNNRSRSNNSGNQSNNRSLSNNNRTLVNNNRSQSSNEMKTSNASTGYNIGNSMNAATNQSNNTGSTLSNSNFTYNNE
jgi:hypothetical protein